MEFYPLQYFPVFICACVVTPESLVGAQVVVNHHSSHQTWSCFMVWCLNRTNGTSQEFIICSKKTFLAEGCWIQLAFSFLEYNDFYSNKQKKPQNIPQNPSKYTIKPSTKEKGSSEQKTVLFQLQKCTISSLFLLIFPKGRNFPEVSTGSKFSFASQVGGKEKIWF